MIQEDIQGKVDFIRRTRRCIGSVDMLAEASGCFPPLTAAVLTAQEHPCALRKSRAGPRDQYLIKFTVLGAKEKITGTPEGTGARKVGNSLADASSEGAHLSSPAPFARRVGSSLADASSEIANLSSPAPFASFRHIHVL